MTTWKGAFAAVLMSGVVVGVLIGHLVVWTCVGAVLGAFLAMREHQRAQVAVAIAKSQSHEVTTLAGKL